MADGAVASLIGGLSFQDSAVQASTAHAIGMLACDQTARQEVCSEQTHTDVLTWYAQVCSNGGLEPVLQLLRSSHDVVLKNAIWMLMICAQCSQVAEEACKLG